MRNTLLVICLLVLVSGCVSNPTLDRCGEIEDPERKYDCYVQVASETKDETICHQLKSTTTPSLPFPQGMYVAPADVCYYKVAIAKEDPGPCYIIGVDKLKSECLMHIAGLTVDTSICQSSEFPHNCISNIARSARSFEICDEIKDQEDRDFCYLGIILELRDTTLCEQLKTEELDERCYNELTVGEKFADENFHYPSGIEKKEWDRRWAIRTGNPSFCEKIEEEGYKRVCLDQVEAARTRCEQISVPYLREWCYISNSETVLNERTVCERLSNVNVSIDECFKQIAIFFNSNGYCKYIVDMTLRLSCAEEVNSKTLCENLKQAGQTSGDGFGLHCEINDKGKCSCTPL